MRHPGSHEYERLDQLAEARRYEVLLHAEGCAECREVLTRHDPSAIFSLLAVQPIPEFSLARLSREIDREIDSGATLRRSPRYGWRAVASVAAALMLAGFFGYQSLRDAPVMIAETVEDTGTRLAPAALGVPGELTLLRVMDSAPERGIELISSPGEAEVVGFALGETQVVMIFDKALDI